MGDQGTHSKGSVDRRNNFDLIRLLAALQVLLAHSVSHLRPDTISVDWLLAYVWMFPGVPIFFILSGYLIWSACERSPTLANYASRRVRRIYPALWVSLAVSVAVMAGAGYLSGSDILSRPMIVWLASVASIAQFADDSLFAAWGSGGVNGALWTIAVELQFYVFAPALMLLWRGRSRLWLWALCAMSLGINVAVPLLPPDTFAAKLLKVSLAPYLFYFCLGILAVTYRDQMRRWVEGRFPIWAGLYIAYLAISAVGNQTHGPHYFLNAFGLIGVILLLMTILSAAFTARGLAHSVLRGHDISYGVYLYHMVVIGLFVEVGRTGNWAVIGVGLLITLGLAATSWFVIERPALKGGQGHVRPRFVVRGS